MVRHGRAWALAALVPLACKTTDPGPSECSTEAECEPGQHCLVEIHRGVGRCVDAPAHEDEVPVRVFLEPPRTDVLLVVDDGPGTAALQARLVASLDAFALAAAARDNDLRVAVTTTSTSDGLCLTPHQATRGSFRNTSCLDRLDEFVTAGGDDAQWLCTDRCTLTTEALGLGPERPWLELRNLPAGIDPVEALACLVPQGISGCEYAEPLRAAEFAWRRVGMEAEPEHGFFREETTGQVVVVTDGVDCSLADDGIAAFDPVGERALWSDPLAEAPTEAVCWNAGVECSGAPTGYDDCAPVDRGLDGQPVDDGEGAVLVPWREYEPFVVDPLELYVIAGVPVDGAEPSYSAAGDPAWLLEHGIDPGCTDAELSALPPVRLRDLAVGLASACAPDYGALLRELPLDEPLCIRPCDADVLEIAHEPSGQGPGPVGACEVVDGVFTVPAGASACYGVVPEAEGCGDMPERSTALVLRTATADEAAAFLLTPNPWSEAAEAECPG